MRASLNGMFSGQRSVSTGIGASQGRDSRRRSSTGASPGGARATRVRGKLKQELERMMGIEPT
jgi:hypothetical protein